MASETTTLRHWLSNQIREVLSRKLPHPPFLCWCDPERDWSEQLLETAATTGFETWAEGRKEPSTFPW